MKIGLNREFYSLILTSIAKSDIFVGPDGSRRLNLNIIRKILYTIYFFSSLVLTNYYPSILFDSVSYFCRALKLYGNFVFLVLNKGSTK